MIRKTLLSGAASLLTALLASAAVYAAPATDAPDAKAIAEARTIVAAMRSSAKGPYSNIQWVCKDGTVLPPKSGACLPHGGGNQFAKFSSQRDRLAALGYPVGTIFQNYDTRVAGPDARSFLRERDLPFERYMVEIDDGWVLKGARSYRGRVQIEDEEVAGRDLLLDVISKADLRADRLLLRELSRTVPHGGQSDDLVRDLRRDSQTLAERVSSFEPLRAEIHGQPTPSTLPRVIAYGQKISLNTENKLLLERVNGQLTSLFSPDQSRTRLTALAKTLDRQDADIAAKLTATDWNLKSAFEALTLVDSRLETATSKRALSLIDLTTALEAEIITASRTQTPPISRIEALRRADRLVLAASYLGYLSASEAGRISIAVEDISDNLEDGQSSVATSNYASLIQRLQLAPGWAQTKVHYDFAEPLAKYTALDGRAARFTDDLLRGSVLQPLTELTEQLARDAGKLSGVSASIMGDTRSALALNPGRAAGILRVITEASDGQLTTYSPSDVIVIPNTTAELFPAAGIITVGEGNPLSHVQILARNLGIPNVVVGTDLLDALKVHDGQRVELAATSDGRVLLRLATSIDAPTKGKAVTPASIGTQGTVDAPIPDLSRRTPVPLSELRADLSGKIVGPKAANVGELSRLFPDRVAPAVALPFGAFAEHVEVPRAKLAAAFMDYRSGQITEAAFLTELDAAKDSVAKTRVKDATRALLRKDMIGFDKTTGVFIRSDTNMEDLPQFTGAGLNLTLPNVAGEDRIFDSIPEVWASVFARRAMAWRSQVLRNPEDVFSSILLMQSVPSEKSGVMVTTDLTGKDTPSALTVSVAYGVGGAVDGESAASYLLTPREDVVLSEAKAPYQRYLKPSGGVGWRPAPSGGLLTPAETRDLRALAEEVRTRYPETLGPDGKPLPFDIEFGFAGGKLYLLQIRPLVQRGAALADALVSEVIPKPVGAKSVNLMAAMGSTGVKNRSYKSLPSDAVQKPKPKFKPYED